MSQQPPPPPPPQSPDPAGPPPQTAQVPAQYGGQPPPIQRTNGMAIAALIFGILGVTLLFGVGAIFALIFGYVARGQIKRSQGLESGSGMAMTGIVLGWIGTIISLVMVILAFAGAIALFSWTQTDDFQDAVDQGVEFIAKGSLEEVTESEAGCTAVEEFPNEGQAHVQDGQLVQYGTSPPTSGPHYSVPAEPGFYTPDSGIEPERLVHNMEHGQIVIWYRPGAGDLGFLQEQVEALVAQEPQATVGAPYPEMPDGYNIVITSWTRARSCVDASQEVVDDFRRQYQGDAPEPITPPFKG